MEPDFFLFHLDQIPYWNTYVRVRFTYFHVCSTFCLHYTSQTPILRSTQSFLNSTSLNTPYFSPLSFTPLPLSQRLPLSTNLRRRQMRRGRLSANSRYLASFGTTAKFLIFMYFFSFPSLPIANIFLVKWRKMSR